MNGEDVPMLIKWCLASVFAHFVLFFFALSELYVIYFYVFFYIVFHLLPLGNEWSIEGREKSGALIKTLCYLHYGAVVSTV